MRETSALPEPSCTTPHHAARATTNKLRVSLMIFPKLLSCSCHRLISRMSLLTEYPRFDWIVPARRKRPYLVLYTLCTETLQSTKPQPKSSFTHSTSGTWSPFVSQLECGYLRSLILIRFGVKSTNSDLTPVGLLQQRQGNGRADTASTSTPSTCGRSNRSPHCK